MKKSIAYLPKQKQEDLYYLVEQIKKKIPETTMIILYGSYARGSYVAYDERVEFGISTTFMSDYDILVVTDGIFSKDVDHKLSCIDDAYYKHPDSQTPVEFICDDIEKLNKDLSEGRYFYTEVKRDGIMLYDSGKHKLTRRRKLHYDEIQQQAKEYYEEKYQRAERFFETAQFHYSKGWYKESSFMLHQTCENLFVATHLTFTLRNKKAHNLAKLLDSVRKFSPAFRVVFPNKTIEENRLFSLLKAAYVEARYNPNFVVTKEDLDSLTPTIGLLFDLVKRICEERIRKYAEMGKFE